jgi:hypothetical protein
VWLWLAESSGRGIQVLDVSVDRSRRLWLCGVSYFAKQEIDFSAEQNGKAGQVEPHVQTNGSA